MPTTVLLLHTLPDGSYHFDWMLQRGVGGLMTFRVARRIDSGWGPFAAERIADHREAYLTYEGQVSEGRGTVRRVAAGECEILEDSAECVRVRVVMGGLRGVVRGAAIGGGIWVFRPEREEA